MTTPQHLLHYVPRPETQMKMGLRALSEGHDGFSALTAGHVWLTVVQPTSTFSAHAQGALRVVSETDSIYHLAHVGITSTTTGGATFAAAGGIKVMAGYGAEPTFQAPDVTIPEPPPAAAEVTSACDEVALAWTVADTVLAVLLTAEAAALSVLTDNFKPRSLKTLGGWLSVAGGTANLAAASVNVAGTQGAPLPGINAHAKGGINITTPMFCSVYAAAGLLFASPYSTQLFGAATVGVVGLLSAGLSSIAKADLASFVHTGVTAGVSVNVKSTIQLSLGSNTTMFGHTIPPDPRQLVTTAAVLDAGIGMRISSSLGEVRIGGRPLDAVVEAAARLAGGGGTPDPAPTMENEVVVGMASRMLASESVSIRSGEWQITVDTTGIQLGKVVPGIPQAPTGLEAAVGPVGPHIQLSPNSATLAAQAAAPNITVDQAGVALTAGGGVLSLTPSAVTYNGFRYAFR